MQSYVCFEEYCTDNAKNVRFAFEMLKTERIERGGPVLTAETDVNGDSKSTNERGPSLVGSLGCRAGTGVFLGPQSPGKLGRQPCRFAYLLVRISGWKHRVNSCDAYSIFHFFMQACSMCMIVQHSKLGHFFERER
jgi:hypothetical protein